MDVEDKDLVATLSQHTEGAPLTAAVYARVGTAVSFTRWLGPLSNYLLARPAARVAAHRDTERTNMPLDAAVVLGLGPDRLHVWGADPMLSQVHDYLGSVEFTRITAIHAETGKSWWPLSITFTADESVQLEARGDVSGFTAAFQHRDTPRNPNQDG
jgi:hypothetical protein